MSRSRAIVTIVHNESFFFPIWLAYYSRFFAPEDIYVFDHQSTDGSTDGDGFVLERVTHDCVDHRWMRNVIQTKQNELVERYDVVLITDVDEIVAPDPQLGTLGDYIDGFDGEFVNCAGYELLHQRGEAPYDPSRKILEQRRWWYPNWAYSKPLLASVPMRWLVGFHARRDGEAVFDPSLHLIHLHRMDYDHCRARHARRSQLAWGDLDAKENWASQNRLTGGDEFDRWFYEDSRNALQPMQLEEIPERWRQVV